MNDSKLPLHQTGIRSCIITFGSAKSEFEKESLEMFSTSANRLGTVCSILIVVAFTGVTAIAQSFDEKFEHWPVDLKTNGRILIDNGISNIDDSRRILKRVGLNKTIVCFQHASLDSNVLLDGIQEEMGDDGTFVTSEFTVLPILQLKEALAERDVVALQLPAKSVSTMEQLKKLKSDFQDFLERKGSLILNAPAAELLGAHFRSPSSNGESTLRGGLNIVPNCVLDPRFDDAKKSRDQMLDQLSRLPRSVGVGISSGTLMMLSGRKITCYGSGACTFMLPAGTAETPRVESISPRSSSPQRPQEFLVDLTEWRRDAIDRTLPPFPPANPTPPFVNNGTLVIVGGGGMPNGLMKQFVELAGGADRAKLVFVPCSESDRVRNVQRMTQAWRKMGVKNTAVIHTKDRHQAQSDEAFLAPLKDATGVWFGGGRQWNFSDSYYGTTAQKLMKHVLQRGGVIGGSSAGASIQARYLARATPIENFRIMAPGYERGGLGFISGVAIDQHFSQRNRQKDMTQLVNRYPQLLGIGLDEATAIIVRKSNAEVVGRGLVHFYDRKQPVVPGKPDFVALPEGSRYDLKNRSVLVDASKTAVETGTHDDPDSITVPTANAQTRVMSFNIRYATKNDGKNQWSNRTQLVAKTIRDFNPDIIGFQEALESQCDFLRREFSNYSFHGTGRRADGTGEHVPLLFLSSRYDLVDSGHFWLSLTPDVPGSKSWDSALPRMVSWVKLKDKKSNGREFLFANAHFDHRGSVARLNSAKLIRSRLAQTHADLPIVLTGDFNTTEDRAPYKELVAATPKKNFLIDSYRAIHAHRTPNESTFSAFSGKRVGSRIDWILHSTHWTTTQARINDYHESDRYPSDHYPIESILRFKK